MPRKQLKASMIVVAALLAGCVKDRDSCDRLARPKTFIDLGGKLASMGPIDSEFLNQAHLIQRCQPTARYSGREWETTPEGVMRLKDGRTFLVFGFVHIADVKAIYRVNADALIEEAHLAGM